MWLVCLFCVAVIFFVSILMAIRYFPVLLQKIWGSWVAVIVFLPFAQRCLWQTDILSFTSWGRVCSSTTFLCCRNRSHSQCYMWKGMLQLNLSAKAVQSQTAELWFQDSHKFLRSYLIQSSCRRCACCAPSEPASLLCELKYCPTLTLAYAWISSLR